MDNTELIDDLRSALELQETKIGELEAVRYADMTRIAELETANEMRQQEINRLIDRNGALYIRLAEYQAREKPKPMKKVKLLARFTGERLTWMAEEYSPLEKWRRVPIRGPKWEKCHAELASAQGREKVYIETLKKIALRPWHSQVRAFAEAAIAQPADDTALKAALKAERERCRLHDAADVATKAMRKAWQLGQTYWQQADSESYRQNAKSAITQDAFNDLLDSTAEEIRALGDEK